MVVVVLMVSTYRFVVWKYGLGRVGEYLVLCPNVVLNPWLLTKMGILIGLCCHEWFVLLSHNSLDWSLGEIVSMLKWEWYWILVVNCEK